MRLNLLGTPELIDAKGREVRDVRGTPLVLLAYLCLHERSVDRAHLADLFWHGAPSEKARHSLRQVLVGLRGALPREALVGEEQLSVARDAIGTDIERFKQLIHDGCVGEALDLWRGRFLNGFSRPDSWELGEWIDREARRIESTLRSAVMTLAQAWIEDDRAEDGLDLLGRARIALPDCEDLAVLEVRMLAEADRPFEAEGALAALALDDDDERREELEDDIARARKRIEIAPPASTAGTESSRAVAGLRPQVLLSIRWRRIAGFAVIATAITLVLSLPSQPGHGGADLAADPAPAFWRQVPSGTTARLDGLWGASPDDVWATEAGGGVHHYDGVDWRSVEAPATTHLGALWGLRSNEIWAGGDEFLHYDGSGWRVVPGVAVAVEIWGSAFNDVWAVGVPPRAIAHFDGSRWSEVPSPPVRALFGVWGTGFNNVWAVGDSGNTADRWGGLDRAAILNYDGSVWSSVPAPAEVKGLREIWGTGGNNIWAVGVEGTIIHFDSFEWRAVQSPTREHLEGVWGTRADDVWAVGHKGTILHFDGSAWSRWASPTSAMLMEVRGVGGKDVWIVGADGVILRRAW